MLRYQRRRSLQPSSQHKLLPPLGAGARCARWMDRTSRQHLHELVRCCAQLEELARRTGSGPGGVVEEACELGFFW